MKKFLTILVLWMFMLGFSAKAYNCPENLYFYVSGATSSTPFTKNQTVFTYTVDASAADVYGVILNYNATSWNDAKTHNAYFANEKYGDISVDGPETWTTVTEWAGSDNSQWGAGCYKFVKGKKYVITLKHANGTFTGSVTVEGESGGVTEEHVFDTTKDYYLDAAACTWIFNDDAVIKVWDGAANVTCEKVFGSILKFRPTATGTSGIIYVKRINPENNEVWNEYALEAPTDAAHSMFVLNSSFNGGEWSTYATPKAWVISKNINNWSADAVSDYEFAYDETTGLYTVSVPADKLRSDVEADNGFKIGYGALNDWSNYYGAAVQNKVMGKGVAADAVKNGSNFIIPTAATTPVALTFNPKDGKLTADWTIEDTPDVPVDPVTSDDTLTVNLPQMDVNGETVVEVTLNAAADKEYCGAQWNIEVPAGFTVSEVALNSERCKDHELIVNVENGVTKCVVYSTKNTPFTRVSRPLFSFKLTAANATVGDVAGKLSNILFTTAPVDGNLSITSKFDDTPLAISVVKAVTKITATPANLALVKGQKGTVTLTIEPEDASDKSVTWSIESGENIIDLDENGLVTAKASGVATIKVTANDGFGAFVLIDVTVDGKKVTDITLSETEHTMYVGDEFTLTATVTPDDATNKAVMWVSSDDNVATVDADGKVTGMSAGDVTIYAIAKDGSNVQATCAVTIKSKVSGDADGDDTLTIADIVIIAKKVVGIDTEGAKLENMDMDGDGAYTITDVTLAVYYLNQLPTVERPAAAQMSSNMLRLTTPEWAGEQLISIPLYLPDATNVAGIQFDVVVPGAVELTADSNISPEASNGHSMTVTPLGDDTYRVVIYSAHNFRSNALGNLIIRNNGNLNGNADFDLNNVLYSNGDDLYATDDSRTTLNLNVESGVDGIFANDADARYDVYSTDGILVASQADKAAVKALPAGIYVIGDKKVIVK